MTKWLVAVDGSEAGERAFQAIVNLAKAGDEVLILTVTDLVYYMLIDPTASASVVFLSILNLDVVEFFFWLLSLLLLLLLYSPLNNSKSGQY